MQQSQSFISTAKPYRPICSFLYHFMSWFILLTAYFPLHVTVLQSWQHISPFMSQFSNPDSMIPPSCHSSPILSPMYVSHTLLHVQALITQGLIYSFLSTLVSFSPCRFHFWHIYPLSFSPPISSVCLKHFRTLVQFTTTLFSYTGWH